MISHIKVLNKYIAVYPDQIDAEIYAAYAERFNILLMICPLIQIF